MISSGSGILDFEPELRRIQPDFFVVNEDGDVPEKQKLCRELGIEYVALMSFHPPRLISCQGIGYVL